jgi:hypothetical protein
MGYERSDRRYGRDLSYGYRPQGPDREYERGYDRGEDLSYNRDRGYAGAGRDRLEHGRQPPDYDYDDRGFFDRAGDEVRSWFGDEEAERRRRWDERNAQREYERRYGREAAGGYGRETSARDLSYRAYADPVLGGTLPAAGDTYRGRRERPEHDPRYHAWRDRQMAEFDRDYDEYRREQQSGFDSDFGGWRTRRQTQRGSLGVVQEHQEVVGSDGKHVGTVDHVRGDRILLTKTDKDAGGHHHSIPSSWITRVADKVEIGKTAEQAQAHWKDEERGGFFRDDERGDGPNVLNRSFSGTY